jgi:peptidoglycan/LPS O-acetylase OafA/YrhL
MRINNFDLIRLFAASQVMVGHTFNHLNASKPSYISVLDAFPGVPIFFVISGFLISASYERSTSLKNYAVNRLFRIYPGLWCCILITTFVVWLMKFDLFSYQGGVWLGSQLLGGIYTAAFLKEFGFGSYNGSLWTIPIELQFYLVLPFFYALAKPIKNGFLIGWILFISLTLLIRYAFPAMGDLQNETKIEKILRYLFIPHFYLFLTGVLIQKYKVYESRLIKNKGGYWIILYVLLFYCKSSFANSDIITNLILAITLTSCAYTSTFLSHFLLRGNDISYGVYICHGLLINIFIESGLTSRMQYIGFAIIATYATAFASWKLIEKPFLRRKRESINPELNILPGN